MLKRFSFTFIAPSTGTSEVVSNAKLESNVLLLLSRGTLEIEALLPTERIK
jgi:hypothetical protein